MSQMSEVTASNAVATGSKPVTFSLVLSGDSFVPARAGHIHLNPLQPLRETPLLAVIKTSFSLLYRKKLDDRRVVGQPPVDTLRDVSLAAIFGLTMRSLGVTFVSSDEKAAQAAEAKVDVALELALDATELDLLLLASLQPLHAANVAAAAALLRCESTIAMLQATALNSTLTATEKSDLSLAITERSTLLASVVLLPEKTIEIIVGVVQAAFLKVLYPILRLPLDKAKRDAHITGQQQALVLRSWPLIAWTKDPTTATMCYPMWRASAQAAGLTLDYESLFYQQILPEQLRASVREYEGAQLVPTDTFLERLKNTSTQASALEWLDLVVVKLAAKKTKSTTAATTAAVVPGRATSATPASPSRPPSGPCQCCHSPGHIKENCIYYACYACGVHTCPGHTWSRCPNPRRPEYVYANWSIAHPRSNSSLENEMPPLLQAKIPKPPRQ